MSWVFLVLVPLVICLVIGYWYLKRKVTDELRPILKVTDELRPILMDIRDILAGEKNERDKKEFLELNMLVEKEESKGPLVPRVSTDRSNEKISTKNPRGKDILIPEGLSEEERILIKEFYDL